MAKVSQVFGEYLPEGAPALGEAELVTCSVDSAKRSLRGEIASARYIQAGELDAFRARLREGLRLSSAEWVCRFPGVEPDAAALADLVMLLRRRSPALNGYFNGAEYSLSGGILDIRLAYGGLDTVLSTSFTEDMTALLRDLFGMEVVITFSGVTDTATAPVPESPRGGAPAVGSQVFAKVAPSGGTGGSSLPAGGAVGSSSASPGAKTAPKRIEGTRKRGDKPADGLPVYLDGARLFYGRPITDSPVPMKGLQDDGELVTVWGEVFSREMKPLRSGEKSVVTFAFADNTGAMTAKMFVPKDSEAELDPLQEGETVLARGKLKYDEWGKENYLIPYSLAILDVYEPMDEAPEKRVELHAHTGMSTLDAVATPESLVRRAHRWGHPAVAITDHGVVQAFPEAMQTAAEIRREDPDFKVIYGLEAYYVDDVTGQEGKTVDSGVSPEKLIRYHMIILVKNQTGIKNLYKLVSRAHLDYYSKTAVEDNPQKLRSAKPLYPRSVIERYREGLLIGSACEQGDVFRSVLDGLPEERQEEIASFYDYLEIQPNGNNAFLLRSGRLADEEQLNDINRRIIAIADKLGKPVVATGDVHFLNKEDSILRTILLSGQGFTDCEIQPPLYLKTTDEMLSDFAYLGERAREVVIDNPRKIAEMVEPEIMPIPEGNYPPNIEGSDDILISSTKKRALELYGDPLPDVIRDRMDRELDAIVKHGFSVMYVTAQKLVQESERRGYIVGSRGSVGSSFVAMLAGISEVNPLPPHYLCPKCRHLEFVTDGSVGSGFDLPPKDCPECGAALRRDGHDIPFETFLGFDGDKVPDIDLNFSGEVQPHIHRVTEELFGAENVFKAGTINAVSDKTAYGYVKHYSEAFGASMSKPQTDYLTYKLAKCKVKRTTGQHPGGMVVVPANMEIYDFCPVQHPADKVDSDMITTHFDFSSIHDCILKLDELGHDVPTIYKYLEEYTGIPVDSVDLSDPEVMSLFTSTKALGVTSEEIDSETGTYTMPELGTNYVREMLVQTKPRTFTELLQVSGLSHGEGVWTGNAQDLIRAGVCATSEVIGTRDDIMMYLIRKGVPKKTAFKIMEIVRKGKAKKLLTDEMVDVMRQNGVPEWYIESCFKIHYMFPKAHAAAYMISALRMGWYKVHRPVEYYCAFFTARGEAMELSTVLKGKEAVRRRVSELRAKDKDATDKEKKTLDALLILREMLCRGIEMLPVDLAKSEAHKYMPEGGKIRAPFSALAGVGAKAAVSLYETAHGKTLSSRDELQSEAGVSKAVMAALDQAGALKALPKSNQISLF